MDEILKKYGYRKQGSTESKEVRGWTTTTYSKKSSTPYPCHCNGTVSTHIKIVNYRGVMSWEIGICAELPSTNWVDFKYYALDYDDIVGIPDLEKKLLDIWEVANV